MPLSNKIISKLQQKASEIENQIKVRETRIRTGNLNNSISFKFINNAFVFKALYYGKFQDEGTYARKRSTKISRTVWPQYIPKGGRTGRGIKPLNFTEPISKVNNQTIIGQIKPIILDEMIKELKNKLK